jgi:hypothetical protein
MPGPYILVVSNGVLANSSDVFGILDPDTGGASTFTVPLSANGQLPATDWACRTHVTAFKNNVRISALGADPSAYLASLGLQRIESAG